MARTILVALVTMIGALPVSVPAGAAPSQRVVYSRSTADIDRPKRHEIFVMNEDGSGGLRLTNNDTEDAFANLSPGGSGIAFSRWMGTQYDLFVMHIDGSHVRRLTNTKPDEVLASWSFDGKWLAFTKTFDLPDGTWQSDIFRIRLRDKALRRVTDTGRTKEFAPDWSPDGELIAFTKQNYSSENYGIATARPSGEDVTWLVINPRTKEGYTDVNPSWSPDSQWVAFSRDHGADPYVDIFKVRRDGSGETQVTDLTGLAENPVWGPDDRIIFMHNEGIAVVPADDGDVSHITPTITGIPYWWPDW